MEAFKLFDSELRVMEVIWENEPVTAKEISAILGDTIGWNKNTTYTIIKKLIEKNIIDREEPNFVCTSRIKKAEVQMSEMDTLIEKLYHGSKIMFFTSFLQNGRLTKKELTEIRKLIEEYDKQV